MAKMHAAPQKSYDVVIVGGAVIGAAVAYFLSVNPDFDGKVLVIEKDTSYAKSSTALSFSSIRTQFSTAINVQISQFGLSFLREFPEIMAQDGRRPDVQFHENGYLFLARTSEQAAILRDNHEVQRACGADVVLLTADEVAARYPHLNADDIQLASLGLSGEGWFDNMALLNGFRQKAAGHGVTFIHDEVVDVEYGEKRASAVVLKENGRVGAGQIVNAAGARAAQVAAMTGLHLPVEPRKRTIFVFQTADKMDTTHLPLMIDPSGVFCRPEGQYFLAGVPPKDDPAVDYDDFTPRYDEFEDLIWPVLAERSEVFEAVKVVNQWAGHYAYNQFDQNLIIGRHPVVNNFLFANGFSGHGLQQAPAVGRAMSELIAYNEYRSLDMSVLDYSRLLENRAVIERAII